MTTRAYRCGLCGEVAFSGEPPSRCQVCAAPGVAFSSRLTAVPEPQLTELERNALEDALASAEGLASACSNATSAGLAAPVLRLAEEHARILAELLGERWNAESHEVAKHETDVPAALRVARTVAASGKGRSTSERVRAVFDNLADAYAALSEAWEETAGA